jgi:hypothetical protein
MIDAKLSRPKTGRGKARLKFNQMTIVLKALA